MSIKTEYNYLDVKKEVIDAEKRIRPYVIETPLEYSRFLSQKA